jgi:hypothetical protein
MQSPNARYGPQPAALKWLIPIAAVVLIILALMLSNGSPFSARADAQPTPCPDAIACHVLKRMPQQNTAPSNTP